MKAELWTIENYFTNAFVSILVSVPIYFLLVHRYLKRLRPIDVSIYEDELFDSLEKLECNFPSHEYFFSLFCSSGALYKLNELLITLINVALRKENLILSLAAYFQVPISLSLMIGLFLVF